MVRYKDLRPLLQLMKCSVGVVDEHENLEARRAHISRFDKSKTETVYNQYLDNKVITSIEIVPDGEFLGLLVTVETPHVIYE